MNAHRFFFGLDRFLGCIQSYNSLLLEVLSGSLIDNKTTLRWQISVL